MQVHCYLVTLTHLSRQYAIIMKAVGRKKCKNTINCTEKSSFRKLLENLAEEDGFIEIGSRSDPRKRRDPAKWKRNVISRQKRENYKSVQCLPNCVHKPGRFKCSEVCDKDVVFIRKIFAKHVNTVDQNRYILSQVIVDAVVRHRQRNSSRQLKTVSPNFLLRLESAKRIRVCKKAFCRVLGVGPGRVTRIVSHYNQTGEVKTENHGGDHKLSKFGGKRTSVFEFISKLKARESHYGRNKSCRLYLPNELKSKKNLWRIYNLCKEPSDRVQYGFFNGIFMTHFNLAFGTPRTDVCSFCLRHKHLLAVERDQQKKQIIREFARAHKLRAKAFYKQLKQRDSGVKTFASDCQQNQALPKIPDQATYFSRQMNLYNFTIAEYVGKSDERHFAYTWTEDQSKKGSNQIASAMCHRLMNSNFDGIHTVRLFSDGCGGQNKNVQVLCMASWWLLNKAPKQVKTFQLVYPVTGK